MGQWKIVMIWAVFILSDLFLAVVIAKAPYFSNDDGPGKKNVT